MISSRMRLVEVAGGFVGEQHLRPLHQRAGDGDALLLAAGQLGRADARAARRARPTPAPRRPARAAPCAFTPSGTRAVSTFSCAVSVGMRLKHWKTKPMFSPRTLVSLASDSLARSVPSSTTSPAVGRSRPPSICRRVDLPPPVGPWMTSRSPSAMVRSTPASASTVSLPRRVALGDASEFVHGATPAGARWVGGGSVLLDAAQRVRRPQPGGAPAAEGARDRARRRRRGATATADRGDADRRGRARCRAVRGRGRAAGAAAEATAGPPPRPPTAPPPTRARPAAWG